ncbi:MAG: SDR family NAD(P)-dependent oxidoreductase [Cyclobacteriaceae bacterium]|nr:SDR family NAD(P)-dependent oxidoreductase [Cyclobacteriaceae bacterium HetDA_MAG_MS6]
MKKKRLALITGATDGIGKAIAIGLAKMGYELIVMGRNSAKYEGLKAELEKVRADISVVFYKADLSLVQDTQSALNKVKDNTSELDLIIQTAGLIPHSITKTNEGIEETFAVSYLTRFLVVRELLPLLLKSNDKILFTVANAGAKGKIYFEDINFEGRKFSPVEVVKQFQQCNDVYTMYLSEKYQNYNLKVYCYNPGLVDTGIHQGWPFPFSFLRQKVVKRLFMKPPDKAAQTPLDVIGGALSQNTVLINSKGNKINPSKILSDPVYQQKVLDLSNSLIDSAMK